MGIDDLKSLQLLRYMIGDFISLTLLPARDSNENHEERPQRERKPEYPRTTNRREDERKKRASRSRSP